MNGKYFFPGTLRKFIVKTKNMEIATDRNPTAVDIKSEFLNASISSLDKAKSCIINR